MRFRKPLFGDIGHTIMRLLVVSLTFVCPSFALQTHHEYIDLFSPLLDLQDFRNYRYSLPMVPGLMVDLEAQRTCIKIPTTGYNEAKANTFLLLSVY